MTDIKIEINLNFFARNLFIQIQNTMYSIKNHIVMGSCKLTIKGF